MPYRPSDANLLELAALLVDNAAPGTPRDWLPLVERAIDERVAPLLHRKLAGEPSIPPELRFRLQRELYRSGALNELLYRELGRLLESAERAGLRPPVVLKGGALAACLYEEIALRPMSDIDLLVPERDFAAWIETCRCLGFEPPSPEMVPGLAAHVHYQQALVNERATFELHFRLVGGRSDWRAPEPEWFRERTEPIEIPIGAGGRQALRLDATAHLLYACAHALLQHGAAQAPLIWIYDLHEVVTRWRDRIDWRELIQSAKAFQWSGALSGGLALARELFGTELPSVVDEELVASAAERRHEGRKADPTLSRAELVWREMGCVAPRDRFRWAVAILFPSPTYMKWRYPRAKWIWPVLYVYRWSVVLREGLGALALRGRGSAS